MTSTGAPPRRAGRPPPSFGQVTRRAGMLALLLAVLAATAAAGAHGHDGGSEVPHLCRLCHAASHREAPSRAAAAATRDEPPVLHLEAPPLVAALPRPTHRSPRSIRAPPV